MKLKIQILIDNKNSFMVPKVPALLSKISDLGHHVSLLHDADEVTEGDILFLLSCEKKFTKLSLNKNNLVIHGSDLPRGKGWSPVTWQILEGKNEIPMTLFEANLSIDSGDIYDQQFMKLNGGELVEEIRDEQYRITEKMALDFIMRYPNNIGRVQQGVETFYKKRTQKDGELNINKSIAEQFNLLRIADNERYPAFFVLNGRRYTLKIYAD